MRANQLPLWFASVACVLLCALHRIGLCARQVASVVSEPTARGGKLWLFRRASVRLITEDIHGRRNSHDLLAPEAQDRRCGRGERAGRDGGG